MNLSDLIGASTGYVSDPNACRNVAHLLPILWSNPSMTVEDAENIYWADRFGRLPSRLEQLGRDIAAFQRH